MFNIDKIVENLETSGFTVFVGNNTSEKTLLKTIYTATGHSFDVSIDHVNKSYETSGDQKVDLDNNPQDVERFSIMDKISRAIWGF